MEGKEYLLDGILLYLIALLAGRHWWPRTGRDPQSYQFFSDGNPLPSLTLSRSAAGLLSLTLLSGGAALALFGTAIHPSLAWGLFGVSVIAAPTTVWIASGHRVPRPFTGWAGGEVVAFGTILIGAMAVRAFDLAQTPEGLWWDESFGGLQLLRIVEDPSYRPVFVAPQGQGPALIYYLALPSYWLFGPSALALRAVSALGGVLGVCGTYLLGRELFGPRAGAISAALIAGMSWHLTWSRLYMNPIWSVAADTFAAYFVLRALRLRSMPSFALAGTSLGIALSMYYSSRLMLLVLLVYLGSRIIVDGRRFLGWNLAGLGILAAVALITVSPLLQFGIQYPAQFNSRIDQVSILKEITQKGSFLPLAENLGKHLLMFNYQGDGNGRHNLPGAPMLDTVTAALFILGLSLATRRFWKPGNIMVLVWLAVMLVPGILSLSFEAPQTLRTIETVVPAAILAALPLVRLWERLDELGLSRGTIAVSIHGLASPRVIVSICALPIVAILAWVGFANVGGYFARQHLDAQVWREHSGAETEIARMVNQLGPEYDIYLGDTIVGHPTVEFLTSKRTVQKFDAASHIPLRSDKKAAMFLEPHHEMDLALLREYYPGAGFRAIQAPGGSGAAYAVTLSEDDLLSLRGAEATYKYAEVAAAQSTIVIENSAIDSSRDAPPMPPPFSVSYAATLSAPSYGRYVFAVEGPSSARLLLDGKAIAGGGGQQELVLAKGNHDLRLTAEVMGDTPIRLLWSPPDGSGLVYLPKEFLFSPPVSNFGLLGSYLPGSDWSARPAFQRIDPALDIRIHTLPLPRPYSVEWIGRLDVPRSGRYLFAIDSADASWVYVDGRLVVSNEGAVRQLREGAIELEGGYHDIKVRFRDETTHTYVRLYWTPPGGQRSLVPPDRLRPPQESYPVHRGVAGSPVVGGGAAAPGQSNTSTAPTGAGTSAAWKGAIALPTGIIDPRDVVLASASRIYLVDTAGKQVWSLDGNGALVGRVDGAFEQPFAAAIGLDGRLYILDSLAEQPVSVYGPDGKPVGRMGKEAGTFRPRGIHVDRQGRVFLADTGRGRVLEFSSGGTVAREFRGGGLIRQPVSVATSAEGELLVVDAEKQRLWVLDGSDRVVRDWPITSSNTFDAPRIAVGSQGRIILSEPGKGSLASYDPSGTAIGRIGTPGRGEGEMDLPTGLRIDPSGILWVVDTRNRRLQQWTVR